MGHVARLGTRSQRLAGRRCARRDTAMGLSPTTSRRGRGGRQVVDGHRQVHHEHTALAWHGAPIREDLRFRLNVIPLRRPPLRQRRRNIPQLAQLFFERWAVRHRCPDATPSPDFLERCLPYRWSGTRERGATSRARGERRPVHPSACEARGGAGRRGGPARRARARVCGTGAGGGADVHRAHAGADARHPQTGGGHRRSSPRPSAPGPRPPCIVRRSRSTDTRSGSSRVRLHLRTSRRTCTRVFHVCHDCVLRAVPGKPAAPAGSGPHAQRAAAGRSRGRFTGRPTADHRPRGASAGSARSVAAAEAPVASRHPSARARLC